MAGQDDDFDFGIPLSAGAQEVDSAAGRHQEIAHQDVRLHPLQSVERGSAVRRQLDSMAGTLQNLARQLATEFFVIDDEDLSAIDLGCRSDTPTSA
jgi:hypothetical protein